MTKKIDIEGYNGKYYITDKGEVYRRYKNHNRKLKPSPSGQVVLSLDGKPATVSITTLIKKYLYGITNPKIEAFRKNGLNADTRPENLIFMTRAEWNKKTGRRNYKAVVQIDRRTGEIVEIYPSLKAAAEALHVSASCVGYWTQGKGKSSIYPECDFMYEDKLDY